MPTLLLPAVRTLTVDSSEFQVKATIETSEYKAINSWLSVKHYPPSHPQPPSLTHAYHASPHLTLAHFNCPPSPSLTLLYISSPSLTFPRPLSPSLTLLHPQSHSFTIFYTSPPSLIHPHPHLHFLTLRHSRFSFYTLYYPHLPSLIQYNIPTANLFAPQSDL